MILQGLQRLAGFFWLTNWMKKSLKVNFKKVEFANFAFGWFNRPLTSVAERIQIVENLRNRPKQSSIGRSLHPAFYLILEAEVIRLSQKLTNKQFSKAVTHHTNWSWPSLKICLTLPSPLSQHHIVYSLCLCLKNTVGALTYDVRCFWGIFDLPTYLPTLIRCFTT